ncbi:MAG: hypothetical protein QOJ99_2247 [Bryobacterales bacterium]|jgi:hypothetical protein|nr:hypothetical protein [Bryobacterales bacterium]
MQNPTIVPDGSELFEANSGVAICADGPPLRESDMAKSGAARDAQQKSKN